MLMSLHRKTQRSYRNLASHCDSGQIIQLVKPSSFLMCVKEINPRCHSHCEGYMREQMLCSPSSKALTMWASLKVTEKRGWYGQIQKLTESKGMMVLPCPYGPCDHWREECVPLSSQKLALWPKHEQAVSTLPWIWELALPSQDILGSFLGNFSYERMEGWRGELPSVISLDSAGQQAGPSAEATQTASESLSQGIEASQWIEVFYKPLPDFRWGFNTAA